MAEDSKSWEALAKLFPVHKSSSGIMSPPSLNKLADLLRRVPVTSIYYNGQTVVLDGYQFIGCRFDNCILKVSSANFELKNCVIDGTTKIEYGGGLQKVIQLFTGRYSWAPQTFPPGFYPQKGPNGTESVTDLGA